MATLKISELSVGDWVRYDDRICQIAEIYHLTYNIGSKKMTSFPHVTLYYEDDMPTYQESVRIFAPSPRQRYWREMVLAKNFYTSI